MVIAILATISVVAYNGVQDRANDSTVQTDLVNMHKQLELLAADDGVYVLPSSSSKLSLSKSAYRTDVNNVFVCVNPTENRLAISGKSKSGKQFKLVDGELSEHGSQLYAGSLCSLINISHTGNYVRGWTTGSPGSWASWTS